SSNTGELDMTVSNEQLPGREWHVYIVRCSDGTLYTGVTNDVVTRIASHNAGRGAKYTRPRLPVSLVWSESAGERGDALRRELEIKRLRRVDKHRLIAGARPTSKTAARRGRSAAPSTVRNAAAAAGTGT